MNFPTHCPACNSDMDGGSILETFKEQQKNGSEAWRNKTNDEIEEYVKLSYSPPYRWSKWIGIEIIGMGDRINYWKCPSCNTNFTRSFKPLTNDTENQRVERSLGSEPEGDSLS